ncbi:MAG: ABC transporter substrate-binding protein [Chromatiales bacterium]|jgi:ABC-type branched-subunit amino acid transport system substrate-binding protein
MKQWSNRWQVVVFGCLLALLWVQSASALTDEQRRGKQIYLRGSSADATQILALVGREGVSLPAMAVPCASCHGPDGRGRPEGGLIPPNIRWTELSKNYGHVHETGRRHPAFDEASLARLLRTGIDPGGNRLDQAMPRYRMPEPDMQDLLAYLKYLEQDLDPGLSDARIQVATLQPLSGPQGGLGRAMAQVIQAHFAAVNQQGGVFGRQLELLVIPYGASDEATLDNLRQALRTEGIFALVGAYTVGLDQPLLGLLREEGVPLIGPFTLDPGDEIVNPAAFYLYPGFEDQARVLADAALEALPDKAPPPVILGPQGAQVDRLVNAVENQLQGRTEQPPKSLRYAGGQMQVEQLAEQLAYSDSLLFFGHQRELEPLLAALAARQANPAVYLLSAYVSRPLFQVPASFQDRIFLAYPTLGSDITLAAYQAYQRLAREHALPPDHRQGQIAAYASAKLLVEGLRRAGRGLNRLALVDALEALYLYETGLTPALTYGPNRRVGARGAHLVTVDLVNKNYQPVGGWHELR